MRRFAGIDWASADHAVCVIDERAKVLQRAMVAHTREGLAELVRALRRFGGDLPVAIERPSGLLVDTLVEAGFQVVPIHPNAVKASRPRYAAAASKTDLGDAFMLADLLRTDGHRFQPLRPQSDETRALRALVRARDDLVAERLGLANQLRALLDRFWPGAGAIFADVDSPIALAFLRRYPTPQSAERLGEKRLTAVLARNAYCGRRSASELLDRLRSAPAGLTGRVNAAQILAELGDDRGRFVSEDHLAAEAGVAPVTKASGKSRAVTFRWACNKRLRLAITCFADNSRHASAWAASVYQRARARGCDHPHATRVLARAWIRVLWRCWCDRKPYDPALHHAAAALVAAG